MPGKMQLYTQMAEQAAKEIRESMRDPNDSSGPQNSIKTTSETPSRFASPYLRYRKQGKTVDQQSPPMPPPELTEMFLDFSRLL